ncbi:hypothetical protein [Lysobacter gummosus]
MLFAPIAWNFTTSDRKASELKPLPQRPRRRWRLKQNARPKPRVVVF